MKREFLLAGAMLLLALGGSAAAQQTRVATPTGQTLRAGLGDVILRAQSREPLPNVFGAPDIFGRTRPTGFVVVQYRGTKGGKAVLLRNAVDVQSDATTMSETGMLIPRGSGTSSRMLYVPPRRANLTQFRQPAMSIAVDWRKNPRVPIAGRTLVIEHADATSITYRVE